MITKIVANRPEADLLLCCARTSKTPETANQIEALLREGIDWEYLLRMARRHRVMPLLYWHLRDTYPKAVPEDVMRYLRDYFHTNNLHNLFLSGELLRLLNAFEDRKIPAVPYKGPALTASVYGNLALREFGDLDILVHRHDVFEAEELLASLGYRPQHRLSRSQREAFLRSQCEHIFAREDGNSTVELHWEITERKLAFHLDVERLWKRLEQITLSTKTVSIFSPDDMLLILCVHGAKHLWERLGWICDIAELLRVHEEDIRWEWVMARAGAAGGRRVLSLGLFLASELLSAPLPEEVSRTVHADPKVRLLAERIISEHLFREADRAERLLDESFFRPLHIKMRERWRDKARYSVLMATSHTVEDWELLPLPRLLFPFYYILRLSRLAGKYGSRFLVRRILR